MSNPLSSFWKGLVSFFTTPKAEQIESEFAQAALPIAETAVAAIAKTNPAVSIIVQVLEPVVNKEVQKEETK